MKKSPIKVIELLAYSGILIFVIIWGVKLGGFYRLITPERPQIPVYYKEQKSTELLYELPADGIFITK